METVSYELNDNFDNLFYDEDLGEKYWRYIQAIHIRMWNASYKIMQAECDAIKYI